MNSDKTTSEVLKELKRRIKAKDDKTHEALEELCADGNKDAIDYHLGRSSAYLRVAVEINQMLADKSELDD